MGFSFAEDNDEMIQAGNLCEDLFLQIANIVGSDKASIIKQNVENYMDEAKYDIRNQLKVYGEGTIEAAFEFIDNTLYSMNPADAAWRGNHTQETLVEAKMSIEDEFEEIARLFDFG